MQSPSAQTYTLTHDQYLRAIHYAHARYTLHFVAFAISALVLILLIRWRVAPRWKHLHPFVLFAMILALVALGDLPAEICGQALSRHYGISIESWPAWSWDWLKEQVLGIGFGTLIALGFFALLRRSPRHWWIYAWLISIPLILASVLAAPLLIEPLFDRFEPLGTKHPDVLAGLQRVLQRARVIIPADHIFEMDASEKTNSLNAYVTGFGPTHRVVLYDTIIRKEIGPPLLTTFGHELGHYVLGHIWKGILFGCALSLAGLYLTYRLMDLVVRRSSFQIVSAADPASLPFFMLIALVLGFLSEPIANAFSRVQEHAADVYSLEVTHGVVPNPGEAAARAFQIEGENDLQDPDPPAFIRFWLFSHPPLADRLRFSLEYNPWRSGQRPAYVQ